MTAIAPGKTGKHDAANQKYYRRQLLEIALRPAKGSGDRRRQNIAAKGNVKDPDKPGGEGYVERGIQYFAAATADVIGAGMTVDRPEQRARNPAPPPD